MSPHFRWFGRGRSVSARLKLVACGRKGKTRPLRGDGISLRGWFMQRAQAGARSCPAPAAPTATNLTPERCPGPQHLPERNWRQDADTEFALDMRSIAGQAALHRQERLASQDDCVP